MAAVMIGRMKAFYVGNHHGLIRGIYPIFIVRQLFHFIWATADGLSRFAIPIIRYLIRIDRSYAITDHVIVSFNDIGGFYAIERVVAVLFRQPALLLWPF